MDKRVLLNNGIIYQRAHKNGLSVESLKEDLTELLHFQEELKKQGKPFYLLFDAKQVKGADSAVRTQALHNMQSLNYKRVAVVGIRSVFLKQMARFIILGMRKQKKIKIFSSREEAIMWLRYGEFLKK